MIRIVSDTSTLYSTEQARQAGFAVSPLSVTIGGNSYREFDEISSDRFVEIINQGNMPISSQPAIGEVVELYDSISDQDEILNISMALGLSGTYTGAVAAVELCQAPERVKVFNSRTLCGPHRYMVEKAVKMAEQGASMEELMAEMERLADENKSYLIPADFGYLRRGGRLSPVVSYVGQAVHLAPIMTQTEDGKQLVIAGVRRGFANAIKYVTKALQTRGVGAGWRVYITHAKAPEKAAQALEILKSAIPDATYEIYPLSPAFITQGGPDCVAVQYVKE